MRRLFVWILLFCSLCAGTVLAQEPNVTVEFEQEDVVVGQPFLVRVKVLVPTFMPQPPVFPSFEVASLIVRLPERSTSPVTENVSGETWSGVQRTYRIYPTREGVISIPPQQVSIVYKDVDTNEDLTVSVDISAFDIVAAVPEGARDLDPLIIAQDVSIEQTWQVDEGELSVGDAVVRNIEIVVTGASALFVPPLLELAQPETETETGDGTTEAAPTYAAFLSYPEDAKVTETIDRGVMSGKRTEKTSYIAQSGGQAKFPEITLDWYDLETEQINQITLPGQDFTVVVPPAIRQPLDWRYVARLLVGLVAAAIATWAVRKWAWPLFQRAAVRLREAYDRTAYAAYRGALADARAKDLTGLMASLEVLQRRGHVLENKTPDALRALTRAIYRDGVARAEQAGLWENVIRALGQERRSFLLLGRGAAVEKLPTLNPSLDNTGK